MERYSERTRQVIIIGMQHTVAADRAVLSGTHLRLIVEEEGCLSAAHSPAAAAPDTMNCEIARKPVFGSVANGTDVSGYDGV